MDYFSILCRLQKMNDDLQKDVNQVKQQVINEEKNKEDLL